MSPAVRNLCRLLAGLGVVILVATAWLIVVMDPGSAAAGGRLFAGIAGLALFGLVVGIIARAVRRADPAAPRDTRLVRPEKLAAAAAMGAAILFLSVVGWLAG